MAFFGNPKTVGAQKSRPGILGRQPGQSAKGPTKTATRPLLKPGCATCGKKIYGR